MTFFDRSEWGARTPLWETSMGKPLDRVYIHHTVSSNPKTDADQIAHMRSWQNQHMAQGWPDIGYNFVIAKGPGDEGKKANRFAGRGWGVKPTAQGNYNSTGYAISAMGNFETMKANDKLIDAIVKQIRNGIEKGWLLPNVKVLGHRDVYATACPGRNLYARLPEIQKRSRKGW